jgi:hypothetical protein
MAAGGRTSPADAVDFGRATSTFVRDGARAVSAATIAREPDQLAAQTRLLPRAAAAGYMVRVRFIAPLAFCAG